MAHDIIRSYKTKGVKEIQTIVKQGTSHYQLQWSDGGQLPAELGGLFTSLNTVDTAVLKYIHTQKEDKVEQTAKEKYYAKQEKKSQEI
tara:strand:+ start:641 stop:904 length:264 start_codon:yes stop_codon:yes gene_type:complete